MELLLVKFLTTAPPIDGVGRAGSWAEATRVGPLGRHDGSPARQATRALVGYDEQCLYVAFHVTDDDVWGTYRQDGDPVYEQEVVEVYLDLSGDGTRYFEIEVSPHNVVLDGVNTWPEAKLRFDDEWHCEGLRTQVTVDGTPDDPAVRDVGWAVTLAIPFAGLGVEPPRPGDVWRGNLYRIDRSRRGEGDEFQAWSPPQEPGGSAYFNVPARFGRLEFAG